MYIGMSYFFGGFKRKIRGREYIHGFIKKGEGPLILLKLILLFFVQIFVYTFFF